MNESVCQKNVKIYMLFSYPACHILGENKEQRDIKSCKGKKYKCSHLMDVRTCSSWLNCALQDIELCFGSV